AIHVVELHAEHRVRQGLDNLAFEFDFLFLGHACRSLKTTPSAREHSWLRGPTGRSRVGGTIYRKSSRYPGPPGCLPGRSTQPNPVEGQWSAGKEALKTETTKRARRAAGVRRVGLQQRKTPHSRMPILEEAGGWMPLKKYDGPDTPASEWENLTYT